MSALPVTKAVSRVAEKFDIEVLIELVPEVTIEFKELIPGFIIPFKIVIFELTTTFIELIPFVLTRSKAVLPSVITVPKEVVPLDITRSKAVSPSVITVPKEVVPLDIIPFIDVIAEEASQLAKVRQCNALY